MILPSYPKLSLYIDGVWADSSGGGRHPVINPATGESVGDVPHATPGDLAATVAAAERGFAVWRKLSAFERYRIMRKAAEILRARAEETAAIMTMEQGKPVAEAKAEVLNGADVIDWFAEEGRRAYGRVIPARADNVTQIAAKEPVGPVAAFTPWNFPVIQAARKVAGALGAGCSMILKGPEETPASCAALISAFHDAELPRGVLNLVFGVPAQISEYLIAHPVIRKISFTGSTAVGKQLAMLAGKHMKRATMELGGHAPTIVFADADVERAAELLAASKYRNAGQVCISPTRFLVQEQVYQRFLSKFVDVAKNLKVADGFDPDVRMGPLANLRRLSAMETFIEDAQKKGAKIETGGTRSGRKGFFFEPMVLSNVSTDMRIMNDEPFGPIAPVVPFGNINDVVKEANRLPYGLVAYAYTGSSKVAADIAASLEVGMVSINHQGVPLPETPFGGVKDSGHGAEGGSEGLEVYLNTKLVSHLRI